MSAKLKKLPESKPQELTIAVEGKIISSNFQEFRAWAMEQIEGINLDLQTDEDFGQAAIDAKNLKSFEETLSVKEEEMLQSLDDVYALIKGTRELKELSRDSRLKLERNIKSKREEVINGMIAVGVTKLTLATPGFRAQIAEAVKNKRSLTLMKEAVDKTVSEINQLLADNEAIIVKVEDEHGESLSFGRDALLVMQTEALKVEMERRVERMKADREKQRLQDELDKKRKEEEAAKAAAAATTAEPDAAERKQIGDALNQPQPAPVAKTEIESLFKSDAGKAQELGEEDEAKMFMQIVRTALAPVKAAREGLKHPKNYKAAQKFADALGAAWSDFVEEVGE